MNRQIKGLLAIFSVFFILLSALVAHEVVFPMNPIVKWVSADAGTCNDAPAGSITGTGTLISYTVPSGKVATGVCIKSGTTHSESLTSNGTYGSPFVNGCYTVSGLGTQTVSVTKNFSSSSCKDLSHIDVYYDNGASPSPSVSPSPSASPSTKPSTSPSASPSVKPSESPSASPSEKPSTSPSASPSAKPSESPSTQPSKSPEASESPSSEPSASPSGQGGGDPSPSASPSTESSATPTPNPSSNPGVGGGETLGTSTQSQVLGLSATSGEYDLSSAVVFALGIISTSAGLFVSKKKTA